MFFNSVNNKINKTVIAAVCAVFLISWFPQPAHAQKIKELFDKEMPEYKIIPEDKFNEMTTLEADVPFGDRSLAYKIRLPKDWTSPEDKNNANYNLSNFLLGEVAAYYSPPRLEARRSKFQILALKLDYEITAEQWLLQYILTNGFTLEGIKFYNKNKVGSLHVFLNDGETYVSRSIAQINGKRMILVNYTIPAAVWNNEASMAAQSLETFELTNPDNSRIEALSSHNFLDIAKISFPESWEISPSPIRSVERIGAKINNFREGDMFENKKVLDGQMQVKMVSSFVAKDLEDELDQIKIELRSSGMLINELIETNEDFDFQDKVDFGFIDVYQANDTNNKGFEYEIWIATIAIKNYYIFLTLLTPQRDAEFFTWSRNVSAFESTIRTFELLDRNMSAEEEIEIMRKEEKNTR